MSDELTKGDRAMLSNLVECSTPATPARLAALCGFHTKSPREKVARHCFRLVGMGYATRLGTRMLPKWEATPAGRAAHHSWLDPVDRLNLRIRAKNRSIRKAKLLHQSLRAALQNLAIDIAAGRPAAKLHDEVVAILDQIPKEPTK